MTVQIAAIVTSVVVLAIIIIGLYVGKNSGEKGESVLESLYKLRSVYFVILLITIVVLLGGTLKSDAIPYPETKTGEPDLTVNVTGSTWSWSLSQDSVPAGKVIEFAVSSDDVTHGFGIYSPEGQILTQVQVMPGYTNKLRYTFDKPGEYKILCMELCGVAHHNMISTLTVTAPQDQTEEVK